MATTTIDPTAVVLEVLNKQFSNYKRWSLEVKNHLLAEDLWDVVADTFKPPKEGEPEFKTWRRSNARALRTIKNSCGTYNFNFISQTSSAKDAWDTLAKMFESVFFENTEEGSSNAAIDGHTGLVLEQIEDTNQNDNDHEDYKDFFNDVKNGYWPTVMEFLAQNPNAVRATIPSLRCTALHAAVKTKQVDIVEKLVDLMKEEDLEIKDGFGCTALFYVVNIGIIRMAECMVEKNKKLVSIGFPPDGKLPVVLAYSGDQWEMACYLYLNTPLTALKSRSGAELISQSFSKKEVGESLIMKRNQIDISWDLIHRCPSLVVTPNFFGHSPLHGLAGTRSAFLSGKQLKFWEQWIYDSISIKSSVTIDSETRLPPLIDDIRINMGNEETDDIQRNINSTGMGLFAQLVRRLLLVAGQYDRIYRMKLIHVRSFEFLRFMCEVTKHKNLNEMELRFLQSAIFQAVERGHVEFINHMLKENPDCANMIDANGMNMFQFAIGCRQEKVYSLIYALDQGERRRLMESTIDNLNNSVLHLVGRLPPHEQLDRINDAALQMQRELQWFKEVESIVPQSHHDLMNITDNMTPHQLFTKNHKELKKEGEKSMKGTATSCTVVSTLAVTMVFPLVFTVPGGNNQETGIPILFHKMWARVLIYSCIMSLSFSGTSALIFLGILTSRYAEVDFLKSLPTKMIFGLISLYLGVIGAIMVAVSAGLLILLEGKLRIVPPLVSVALIPIITLVSMQVRLLKEMVVSTYGAGIFQRGLVEPRH